MSPPPDLSTASDQQVVAWALKGREDAYRQILLRYQRPVLALIYHKVGDRELAEDLAQEAFVRAVAALDTYRPEFKFSNWMLKIATNVALSHLRRRQLETVGLDAFLRTDTPDRRDTTALRAALWMDSAPTGPRARALRQAMGRLREEYRQAIILRDIEGRSYDEMAEILHLPRGTVSTYVNRARAELKKMLGATDSPATDLARG